MKGGYYCTKYKISHYQVNKNLITNILESWFISKPDISLSLIFIHREPGGFLMCGWGAVFLLFQKNSMGKNG
jgi:hypothetical protein